MRLAAAAAASPADAGAADADVTDADVDVDGVPAADSAIGWLTQVARYPTFTKSLCLCFFLKSEYILSTYMKIYIHLQVQYNIYLLPSGT